MTIKTKVNFKEYVKLIFKLAYERTVLKILLGVAALVLLWVLFYYLDIFNLPEPIIYQYITLGLILVAQPTILFLLVRRNYYSSNQLQERLETEMTPKEIKVIGESFYMEVKWEKLFKVVEKTNWFLFYQNSFSAIVIPKNDLTESEQDELRALLKTIQNVPVELREAH